MRRILKEEEIKTNSLDQEGPQIMLCPVPDEIAENTVEPNLIKFSAQCMNEKQREAVHNGLK